LPKVPFKKTSLKNIGYIDFLISPLPVLSYLLINCMKKSDNRWIYLSYSGDRFYYSVGDCCDVGELVFDAGFAYSQAFRKKRLSRIVRIR
jgi:hypothetical protein